MGLGLNQYLFDFVGGMLFSMRNEVKRRILLEELTVEQPAPKTIQEIIDEEKQMKWMQHVRKSQEGAVVNSKVGSIPTRKRYTKPPMPKKTNREVPNQDLLAIEDGRSREDIGVRRSKNILKEIEYSQ